MLKGKVIIVTGANGLLGRAFVNDLKSKGAKVISADIVLDNDIDQSTLKLDVTSETSIQKGLEWILRQYGKIDGLVNNAYPRTKDWGIKYEDIPYVSWEKNVSMQMNSIHLVTQKFIPELIKSKGSVVNISSIYGIVGPSIEVYDNTNMTMPAAYSAIKGGLINYTKYISTYFGSQGVRANVVSPGGILDGQPDSFVAKYKELTPLKRMGKPEDIAPSVSFLLSDEALYITGQNIIVDGGWTAR